MSDEKPVEPKSADELIETKKPGDVQLNEQDLNDVSGGFNNISVIKLEDKSSPKF